MAVKAVHSEIQSVGKARAQSVGTAKQKLVNYGQRARIEVKSTRSAAVNDIFHYFLLFLHQGAGSSRFQRILTPSRGEAAALKL